MEDRQYIKELESRCLKAVTKLERIETRERNLELALQLVRNTKSTIPEWIRELAKTALDVAKAHRTQDGQN